jgi:hypothetical protein
MNPYDTYKYIVGWRECNLANGPKGIDWKTDWEIGSERGRENNIMLYTLLRLIVLECIQWQILGWLIKVVFHAIYWSPDLMHETIFFLSKIFSLLFFVFILLTLNYFDKRMLLLLIVKIFFSLSFLKL